MKKSLIALATMSAFAGAAFAQSNVQLYGIVDAGVEHVSSGGVSTTKMESGIQSGSRFGVKGSEDLGGGLTAKFQMEQGVKVDNGAAADATKAFSRQAWLGVASKDMGEVRLGRQNAPIRGVVEAVDPFSIGLAGSALKFVADGSIVERTDNAVTYLSPSMSGFQAQVQYGMGETTQSTTTNGYLGLSATYSSGPLMVAAAYAKQKTNLVPADEKETAWVLGGTYDFGVAKAHVAFVEGKFEDNVAVTSDKARNYLLGVSKSVGSHNVMASYIDSDIRTVADADSKTFALGYTYSLSKRTNLYTSYARTSNDADATLGGAAAGESISKYNLGVRHQF